MPHKGNELKDRKSRAFHDSLVSVETNPLSGRNIRSSKRREDLGQPTVEVVGHFEYDFENETEVYISGVEHNNTKAAQK